MPKIADGFVSSWAQYTVQLAEGIDRAKLQEQMKNEGIPTMVYYPRPMHVQGAFAGTDSAKEDCPITEHLCRTVLSFPMHPYLTDDTVAQVADALISSL